MTELLITLTCFTVVIIPAVIAFNWSLKNYLFGWDYVHHTDGGDGYISRVRKAPSSMVYYNTYDKIISVTEQEQVKWLTCLPEKYMFDVKGFEDFK